MSSPERDAEGFRRRSTEVTRLQAFVDAAFAFAVTLLVISLEGIPRNSDQLIEALAGIPAFAASCALLAQLWSMHTRYTWRFGLEDGPTTFLAWISGGALPAHFEIRNAGDLRIMYMVYGLAGALLGGVVMALYRHALRQRERIEPNAVERPSVRLLVASLSFMPVLGTLSITIAALVPEHPSAWMLAMPGFVYFGMFFQWPLLAWCKRRWRRQDA